MGPCREIMSPPSSNLIPSSYISPIITFVGGAAYGFTNVVVGQPFDTCKTCIQAMPPAQQRLLSANPLLSALQILKQLYTAEGIRGWYRGGAPMIFGGSLMRSMQYGITPGAYSWLQNHSHIIPCVKFFGFIDSHVVYSGAIGGMARSIVEIPTDFIKIRRQVKTRVHLTWTDLRIHVLDGSGVTLLRNTLLFSSFIVYIDIAKQLCLHGYVPSWLCTDDGTNLSPFAKGAICANLAWITVWPLDLVKTQIQSGNFDKIPTESNTSSTTYGMLKYNILQGHAFRGLLPGIVRSTLANGASMVAYEWVQSTLTRYFRVERNDNV